MVDPLVAHDCHYLDGFCSCKHIRECKYGTNVCIKEGMTIDTCRYNPRLGCDCGYHRGHIQYSARNYPL